MPIYALDNAAPEFPPEGQYWVAPDAILIGRVRLMKGASVWWGCVLRGDVAPIIIGENSNVQDMTMIHCEKDQPVTIGANCTIGHRVTLHSTTIGDGCLIGIGATLLNRSRIGNSCLVGANSLVTEGVEFAEESVVMGAPAKLVRKVGDRERALLKGAAAQYVHNHIHAREKLRLVR